MTSNMLTPSALLGAAQAGTREVSRRAADVRRFLTLGKGVVHVETAHDVVTGAITAVAWVLPTPAGLPQRRLPDGTVVSELNGYETEYLHQEIFVDQVYLPAGLDLPVDAVIVDIGANIGMFSLFAARLAPQGRVIACEPGPDAYAALATNVETLGLPVTPLPCAVGGADGREMMTSYPGASVFSGLRADPLADRTAIEAAVTAAVSVDGGDGGSVVAEVASSRVEGAYRYDVEVRSLSSLLASINADRVDLVKIDAEGCEVDILAELSGDDLARIDHLVVEVHTELDKSALISLLGGAGFDCTVGHLDALDGTGFANLYARRRVPNPVPSDRPALTLPPAAPALSARHRLWRALDAYLGDAASSVTLDVRTDAPPATVTRSAFADPGLVAEIRGRWQRLLGVDVRADDDFFSVGGTSLLAVRMLAQLRGDRGHVVGLEEFLAEPTAVGLAARCT